ncbi:ankyrin repeat domain-containing protein 33B [Silurus meridionalis]|nr:ankyrin repeat domain-containing protein 33B [Silurus meridionalis]
MAGGSSRIVMETFAHSSGSRDAEENEDSCYPDYDDNLYLVDDDDDDDDDIYQEFEELDFFQLPDAKSIASDDSFYPPDNLVVSQRSPTPEGPEHLSFFMACCSNNAIIVKIMIRQGVSKEEVREVDKNNRVTKKDRPALNKLPNLSSPMGQWVNVGISLVVGIMVRILLSSCLLQSSQTLGGQMPGYCPPALGYTLRIRIHIHPSTQPFLTPSTLLTLSPGQGLNRQPLKPETGLIVACYQGYVDVVIALSQCPYINVNWQDSEGNTALMTAAQAGHIMITNFLLNYYAGVDIELRNCHGFTAIMKAAMQGRAHCVRALMMSGADIEVRDYGRKLMPLEWALFTGRYETARMMQRLMSRPCAEQFCDSFCMEWPKLSQLVCQAKEPQPCWREVSERMCGSFNFRMRMEPLEEGALDYMVRLTTALASPLVATACSTVCPGSPPCVGKHRPAVPDMLQDNDKRREDLKGIEKYKCLFQNGRVPLVVKEREKGACRQVPTLPDVVLASSMTLWRSSLLPLHMIRRRSVCPGLVVPRVRMCKAPPPTYIPERSRCRSKNSQHLQVPKWKYKLLKKEKEQEKQNDKLRLPTVKKR